MVPDKYLQGKADLKTGQLLVLCCEDSLSFSHQDFVASQENAQASVFGIQVLYLSHSMDVFCASWSEKDP